jgi:spore coat polysaccharide biosynthesis predicted glycosyltransferase SpsG
MELIKRIKDRAPEYDAKYANLIYNFTIQQGGKAGTSSEETRWVQGKYFSTVYEFYMYAALIGLKKDYAIPISYGTAKNKFIEMRSWKPNDLVDYIIMCLLGKTEVDFLELEKLEEELVEKKLSSIRSLLEDYANGGFDLIQTKIDQDNDYFTRNENSFLDFLEE